MTHAAARLEVYNSEIKPREPSRAVQEAHKLCDIIYGFINRLATEFVVLNRGEILMEIGILLEILVKLTDVAEEYS